MSLVTQYDAAIERQEITNDPLQRALLISMERVADALNQPESSWWSWGKKKSIKGLYVYGPVGAGKTYCVDLFFSYLNEPRKARFHFHHFMQQIDVQLRLLQGKKDPLQHLAKKIAQSVRLLCFDEFLVHDVAYAMILAELLQALNAQGVILVISSNTKPDDLYLNGVQRARFLPAIALINARCDILFLNETRDYRLGREPLLEAYIYPLNTRNEEKMRNQFLKIAPNAHKNGTILIQNREIPYLQCDQKSIWFAFKILCNLPRSQLDYLELSEQFDTIFISGIPKLTENHTIQTIMFIHFIDVMYDRGINVILAAEVPIEELYVQGELKELFKRTLSRLNEMQSVDYINRHPRREIKNIL